MECPHLTVHREAPMEGLSDLEIADLFAPCGIDGLRVLATVVAHHMSVGSFASGLK